MKDRRTALEIPLSDTGTAITAMRQISEAAHELVQLRNYGRQLIKVVRTGSTDVEIGSLLRFYPQWRRSLRQPGTSWQCGIPWLTFAAREFLERVLTPQARVFEFGCGGSTVFFGSRVREVISVEHDPGWAQAVTEVLERAGMKNCAVKLIELSAAAKPAGDPADPAAYRSGMPGYLGMCFREYARAIDPYPPAYFDLVLVDGRARPSCFVHSMEKIRAGGYLVLDNAEREHYRRVQRLARASAWEPVRFFGPGPANDYFWNTCIWRKAPAADLAGERLHRTQDAGPTAPE